MIIILIILVIFHIVINFKNREGYSNINPIQNYFGQVYVITLDKRKEYIKNFMDNIGLNPIYFPAIRKDEIEYRKLINNNQVKPKYYKKSNEGRIACQQSHNAVLKDFLKSNKQTVLIFEDDLGADINKGDLYINFNRGIKHLPNDWDILFLGRCWDSCSKQKLIEENMYKLNSPLCRHAYAVTRKGAQIILNNNIPQYHNGDVMNQKLIVNGDLKAYGFVPQLFHQNREELGSNLGNRLYIKECVF